MMRRLLIVIISATAIGTAYCSSNSPGWTTQHAEARTKLNVARNELIEAAEKVVADKPADLKKVLDRTAALLHKMNGLDTSARDEDQKSILDYQKPVIELQSALISATSDEESKNSDTDSD